MSRVWWREVVASAALEALRCECGELHCYWCGLEFVMVPGGRWSRGVPSREHVEARRDERGRIWRGERIVAAHAVCNNKRGIALWIPFHSAGTKPKGQIVAEREVRVLVKDWRSRA